MFRIPLPRPKPGPALAFGLAGGLALWMASGPQVTRTAPPAPETASDTVAPRLVKSVAMSHVPRFTSYGEARPNRLATLSVPDAGTLEHLVEKGRKVMAGDVVARVAIDTLDARLAEATARFDVADRDLKDARELNTKGLATDVRLRGAEKDLAAARAALEAIRDQAQRAELRAPFDGFVEARAAEVGTRVSTGQDLLSLVDIETLRVETHVPQVRIGSVNLGQRVEVAFATGETAMGDVVFIGRNADAVMRSFPVEVAIANPGGLMRSGVSASVSFEMPPVRVHEISPAYLSLSPEGELQVRAGTPDGLKAFPVELVDTDGRMARVSGLPDVIEIATTGQASAQTMEPSE